MGKSSFMKNLSRNLASNSFAIRIDLNKYFTELKDYQITSEHKRSIRFLCSLNIFKTDLENALIRNFSSNRINLKWVVLFDGLDEISPYYKEAVIDIVDDLKEMNAKIVITTRPHLKEELENHFGVFSHQMTKFNFEKQKQFLIDYWTLRSKKISFDDVAKRAQDVLEKISKSINDRERLDLTGIPLQLKLLSEIYLVSSI